MIMSKKSESCQMVNMTCKCKKTSENEFKIQMNCVEPRLLSEIVLDFNHFKIETNETIGMKGWYYDKNEGLKMMD